MEKAKIGEREKEQRRAEECGKGARERREMYK